METPISVEPAFRWTMPQGHLTSETIDTESSMHPWLTLQITAGVFLLRKHGIARNSITIDDIVAHSAWIDIC